MSRFFATTLRLVRDQGPLSRTELMREMGISSPSLTKIANSLIAAGRLREIDLRDEGSFGRPRQYLDLADNSWRVIAASLMPGRLELAVCGHDGRLQARQRVALEGSLIDAIAPLRRSADLALQELGVKNEDVLGLCLTLPGHVDTDGRHLLALSRAGWGDGPVIETLEAALPWPVTLVNKVNAMAFAEAKLQRHQAEQLSVYIYLDQGLGGGLLRQAPGAPFSGRDALELGHIRVQSPGLPCGCGQSGCLETLLNRKLIAEADALLSDPAWPIIAQNFANLINLMNPDQLILGGALTELSAPQHERLVAQITAQVLPHLRHRVDLRNSALGPDATLHGAAKVALDNFYFSGRAL